MKHFIYKAGVPKAKDRMVRIALEDYGIFYPEFFRQLGLPEEAAHVAIAAYQKEPRLKRRIRGAEQSALQSGYVAASIRQQS